MIKKVDEVNFINLFYWHGFKFHSARHLSRNNSSLKPLKRTFSTFLIKFGSIKEEAKSCQSEPLAGRVDGPRTLFVHQWP